MIACFIQLYHLYREEQRRLRMSIILIHNALDKYFVIMVIFFNVRKIKTYFFCKSTEQYEWSFNSTFAGILSRANWARYCAVLSVLCTKRCPPLLIN